ncbi:AMP-binding protein [Bradyrhizobium sp. 188]|uniref:AMP-binding protein n=1 Tax=Bradyrhizobium sp. 188 TaxID=2782656 RepID=UPI001FFA77F6|nr:AMP-binding protein [Bradyrhizobium sp. 188]MCK1502138.1 AMP-binding protein [Bradyrhizobium sp. 188]
MDLRQISRRIADHKDNAVFTFESGQTVRRNFPTVSDDIAQARARLARCGIERGMRVGIRSPNCYDWLVHDIALLDLGAVSIAFTAEFEKASREELCRKYQLSLFLAGAAERSREPASATSADPVYFFGHDNGEVQVRRDGPPQEDPDYHRPGLIFSSGSAGGLKGLVLNRCGIEACIHAFTQAVEPVGADRLLIFLPISNFQQRLMYYSAFWYGFDVIVVEPVHLFRALQELSPTILIAPPAFYETFETRFHNLPEAKRRMATAIGRLISAVPSASLRGRIARKVFRDAYQALGGSIRFMVTGMAPIKQSTLNIFEMMQMPLFDTYGLIESGSVALNLPGAYRLGSVGKLLPGVRVEFAHDNEIFVHRDQPMAVGYFECAEGESERTFVDGAVATGDIGRMDSDGFLYLIGRKKEIIVTSGGEKLHPEVIEAQINNCADVERAVVFGRENLPTLAVVVRPKRTADAEAQKRIRTFIDDLNRGWRNASVTNVIFTDVEFSRENGFLRPNLKLARNRIGEYFSDAIRSNADNTAG